MNEDNVTELRRISKGKTAARGINTFHTSIFSILNSITSKGVFYVNCAFNWVAGMALGGWLLAFGSLCNDFSMKDYLHKIKGKEVHGNDKRLCITGFMLCAINSFLCLCLCLFMFHDMASSSDYYKAKVLEEQARELSDNLKLFDKNRDEQNYAAIAQDLRTTIKAKANAKIQAREGKDYASEHAIFEKTILSKDWCTLFMCLCVFINAFISAWLEREEVTVDDLDEDGNVIRKNHGFMSKLRSMFNNQPQAKPIIRARALEEAAA